MSPIELADGYKVHKKDSLSVCVLRNTCDHTGSSRTAYLCASCDLRLYKSSLAAYLHAPCRLALCAPIVTQR